MSNHLFNPSDYNILLTKTQKLDLRSQMIKKGLSIESLHEKAGGFDGELTPYSLGHSLLGSGLINFDRLIAVYNAIKEAPDIDLEPVSKSLERIPLTPEMKLRIRDLMIQKGLNAKDLFRIARGIDPTFTHGKMSQFLEGPIKTVIAADYDLCIRVMQDFRDLELPTLLGEAELRLNEGAMEVRLTQPIVRRLKSLHAYRQIDPSAFFEGRNDIPHGLTASELESWLSRSTSWAKLSYLDYVFKTWAEIMAENRVKPTF